MPGLDGDARIAGLLAEAGDRLRSTGARLVMLLPAPPAPDHPSPMYSYSSRMQRLPVLDQLLKGEAQRRPERLRVIDARPSIAEVQQSIRREVARVMEARTRA